ncbi:MAG: glycosyltransferase, partial [Bacteroidales bacterium]|nr:glycosyltransferase [Bacteroidales bacterium]
METYVMITGILLSLTGLLYFGLIGLFTMGWKWAKGALTSGSASPGVKVSVIIAARNEEKNIALLLADLKNQDYPPELLQVIVVDDHSEDNTAEIAGDFIAKHGLAGFKVIKIENDDKKGKKAAITHGISSSAGSLILVTDADCRLQPGWISAMDTNFQDDKIMMIFGPVSYSPRKGLLNKFQSLEFSALVASGGGAASAGYP